MNVARASLASFSPSRPTEQENKPTPMRELKDEFLNASSVAYLEEMEKRMKEDGDMGMDKSWATLLKSLDSGMTGKELSSMWEDAKNGNAPVARERRAAPSGAAMVPSEVTSDLIQESMRLLLLVRAYQTAGH